MGLKDELEARLSTSDWAHEAEELYEGWAQLAPLCPQTLRHLHHPPSEQ
jgi:hypothetical protein